MNDIVRMCVLQRACNTANDLPRELRGKLLTGRAYQQFLDGFTLEPFHDDIEWLVMHVEIVDIYDVGVRQALSAGRLALQNRRHVPFRQSRQPQRLYRDIALLRPGRMPATINRLVDMAHAADVHETNDFETIAEYEAGFERPVFSRAGVQGLIRNLRRSVTGIIAEIVRGVRTTHYRRSEFILELVAGSIVRRDLAIPDDGFHFVVSTCH